MKKLILLLTIINLYAIEIKDVVICERIVDKNPVNADTIFKSGVGWLYCWCNLSSQKMETIYHEWIYEDSLIAKIKLQVKFASENYRIWSKKRIFSLWIGEWKVLIKNEKDSVLKEIKFKIIE